MRNDLDQLTNFLKPYFYPKTFMEVGSRDGLDTKFVCEFWGIDESKATIIEANIFCYQKIQSSMIVGGKKPFARVIYGAASNYNGEVKFNCVDSDRDDLVGISSIKKSLVINLNYKETIVPCFRLDSIIKHESIDLMKIDVEGHAFEVLEGLGSKIHDIKGIQVETESTHSFENQKLDSYIHNFLVEKDFELIDKKPCWDSQFDCLYINKNIK